MKVNRRDLNKCGIYCIRNIINNKIYIGKSKNIYTRIAQHIQCLNKESKDENRYLIHAWNKYGRDNFEYFVLEYFENIDDKLLSERELFWIEQYHSIYSQKGYNLRIDSSTKMIVHNETRKLQSVIFKGKNNPNYGNKWSEKKKKELSNKIKQQYLDGRPPTSTEVARKGTLNKLLKWENNPELKQSMIDKVRKMNTKYNIYQYDKNYNLIKIWDCINDILIKNPNYKKHNIFAVCSGDKPSIF